jgi:hypothetical protein
MESLPMYRLGDAKHLKGGVTLEEGRKSHFRRFDSVMLHDMDN